MILLVKGKWCQLSDEETLLFQSKIPTAHSAEFFESMIYKHCRFSTEQRPNTKHINNSFILIQGEKFAKIKKIFRDCVENHIYIIVQLLKIRGRVSLTDRNYGTFVTHFVRVEGLHCATKFGSCLVLGVLTVGLYSLVIKTTETAFFPL